MENSPATIDMHVRVSKYAQLKDTDYIFWKKKLIENDNIYTYHRLEALLASATLWISFPHKVQ